MMTRFVLALVGALVAGFPVSAGPYAGAGDKACQALLDYSAPRRGLAVLVFRDGKPICEGYAGAGGPDHASDIWSGTKSFTGIMAAAAVQDGLLTLDEPASKTIAEWRSDPQKSQITIRQLLSLTSGLPNTGVGRAPPYSEAVATPLAAKPGEVFQYGPAPFQVFGEIMKRKLKAAGRDPDPLAYLKTRIADPIGMKWADWRRTSEGDPILPQGSVFTVREWIKFGEFVRAGGVVEGKPLVDRKTLAELFKGSKVHAGYGVSWWLPFASDVPDVVTASLDVGRHAAELPQDMVIAGGAGDQRLYVIPSRRMTVAREASFDVATAIEARRAGGREPRVWSDTEFLRLVLALP